MEKYIVRQMAKKLKVFHHEALEIYRKKCKFSNTIQEVQFACFVKSHNGNALRVLLGN